MDEEIMAKLVVAETPDDVQVIAKEYDIELSDEDAASLFADIEKMREPATGSKVNDEELGKVAGGYDYNPDKLHIRYDKDLGKYVLSPFLELDDHDLTYKPRKPLIP